VTRIVVTVIVTIAGFACWIFGRLIHWYHAE
jgi:hypothetical protein